MVNPVIPTGHEEANKNTIFNDNGDYTERVEKFNNRMSGSKTDVEEIAMPEAGDAWLDIFSWLLARVDSDTVKFGDPNNFAGRVDSELAVLHRGGGSNGDWQLSRVHSNGDITTLADDAATELAQNLFLDTTNNQFTIGTDDGTNHKLTVREQGDTISIEYGDNNTTTTVTESTKTVVGQNAATSIPKAPLINKTAAEIERTQNLDQGSLVYSVPDGMLLIEK